MRRREALVIGGAVAVALAIPPVLRRWPSDFAFEPLPGVPGFRQWGAGATSGGVNPFLGLGSPAPSPAGTGPEAPFAPCQSLFGTSRWDPERLPVAVFSDFFCPYCRELEQRLQALEDEGGAIRLIWHELPLLGEGSTRAARAMIAAQVLGSAPEGRAYLRQNPLRPGPRALGEMAESIGIDPDLFRRAESGPRVLDRLQRSLALGARLGIYGTPATVVGRTLVIGSVKDADLRKLIELERAEGPIACG